jgi:hypothetical protein
MLALKPGTWPKATPVYSLCSFRISRVADSLASDSDALSSGVTVLCTVVPGAGFYRGLWAKPPRANAPVLAHR